LFIVIYPYPPATLLMHLRLTAKMAVSSKVIYNQPTFTDTAVVQHLGFSAGKAALKGSAGGLI